MQELWRSMARYNRWMNEKLYARAAALPEEARRRDLGAFFRSIHGTFNHLLLTDRLWMGRFLGEPYAIESLDQELHTDFTMLRAEREREDARIVGWIDSLSGEDLDRELEYTTTVSPRPMRHPLWFALGHFFNHQTHHRGQVTTLLRQLDVDPGVTDLIWLPAAEWEH